MEIFDMDMPLVLDLPLWLFATVFIVVMLVALEIGYRVGKRKREASSDEDFVGRNVVVTSIFATFGLILAFTYAYTVSRSDMRKQVVAQEANAIGTAFLRAGLVPDPGSTELKRALLDYARTRLVTSKNIATSAEASKTIRRSLQAQSKLWPITVSIVKSNQPGPIEASLVAAVNQVLDAHRIRLARGFDRLPGVILLMILFISATALVIAGFTSGLSGRFSRWRMTALALILSFVIFIIIDFDYPTQGFIRIHQQPLKSTIAEMEANLARNR